MSQNSQGDGLDEGNNGGRLGFKRGKLGSKVDGKDDECRTHNVRVCITAGDSHHTRKWMGGGNRLMNGQGRCISVMIRVLYGYRAKDKV